MATALRACLVKFWNDLFSSAPFAGSVEGMSARFMGRSLLRRRVLKCVTIKRMIKSVSLVGGELWCNI